MNSLSITSRLTLDDWHAYVRACTPRLLAGASTQRQFVRLAIFVLLGIALGVGARVSDVSLHLPSFLAGCLLLAVSFWFNARAVRRIAIPDLTGQFRAPLVFDFDEDGLHIRRDGSSSFTSWSRMQSTTLTADHLFLWVDRSNAHIVPSRDLPPDIQAAQLKSWIDERIGNARPAAIDAQLPSVSPPATAVAPSIEPSIVRPDTRGRWSIALLRTICLRPALLPPRASGAVTVALSVVALGVWTLIDWFANRPDPQLQLYGVPSIGWYALLMLAIATVLARTSMPSTDVGRVLTLTLGIAPVAIVFMWLVNLQPTGFVGPAGALVSVAYLVAYANRGLTSLTGAAQPTAITRALLIVVLFGVSAESLYVEPNLWISAQQSDGPAGEEQPDDTQARQLAESLLYEQPARIEDAVAALTPGTDSPAAYFLGFAGMGEQRVFAEEIKLAASVVGNSFGSTQRSLLLVNDVRDAETLPLANPTSLRYALQGIAAKMHIDRDVLFLSLSSHGAQDATIAVSDGPLPLNDLSAGYLADALAASGIKWRVVIVSACYSGTFIEPLKNPYTAVITASAADRTSFGCSDDRDLTYFGEAFYRDALPKAASLRQAYKSARAAIRQREMSEGITASRPQAWFGGQIEAQLLQLQ